MGTGSGLAAAFFRLYILHALERAPARPAAILASLHSREGALPLESSAFSKALHQLLDAGLVVPGELGSVALTPMGRRERDAQRVVWERLLAVVTRLLQGDLPAPEPPGNGGVPHRIPVPEPVPDAYRERVVLAELRGALRRAREKDEPLGVALAEVAIAHSQPLHARAMLQRSLRETLGRARSTFAPGASAFRYGPQGVCLIAGHDDIEVQAELLRVRLLESLGAMTATVRAFAPARYAVRVGTARWSSALATSSELLRAAEAALGRDGVAVAA